MEALGRTRKTWRMARTPKSSSSSSRREIPSPIGLSVVEELERVRYLLAGVYLRTIRRTYRTASEARMCNPSTIHQGE